MSDMSFSNATGFEGNREEVQFAGPGTSAFYDPEIVVSMKNHHHARLIARSEDSERVLYFLEQYSGDFARVFLASMPSLDRLTPA